MYTDIIMYTTVYNYAQKISTIYNCVKLCTVCICVQDISSSIQLCTRDIIKYSTVYKRYHQVFNYVQEISSCKRLTEECQAKQMIKEEEMINYWENIAFLFGASTLPSVRSLPFLISYIRKGRKKKQ